MNVQTLKITGITGGLAPSSNLYGANQFLNAIGIDPDYPLTDGTNDFLPSGLLRPTAYAKFSSTSVTAAPKWLTTTPKTSLVYTLLDNGRFISYNSSFASETLIATASGCTGNGMVYYNNYIYVFRGTNVDRYGPLDGTPAYSTSVWTGATLGSLTALTDTTYPTMRDSVTLPNHVAHVHSDGSLYFADFVNGQGIIHRINTKKGTYEGDTNGTTVASAYNVLDLPFGYMPTAIASLGTDLVIAATQTSNSTLKQGDCCLFFWDCVSSSFYAQVPVPDTYVTALKNANGYLYIFSGNAANNGYRLSYYAGGYTIKTIYFSNEGYSPLQGAVTAFCDKLFWGSIKMVQTTSNPEYYGVVMSAQSKDPNLPLGIQVPVKTTLVGSITNGVVPCIAAVEQTSFSTPRLIVGWKYSTTYGIDKISTTYTSSIFHGPKIHVGRKFIIRRIRVNLPVAIAANMTITPAVFLDNFTSSSTVGTKTINNTNYPNSEMFVEWKPDINGKKNFILELRWSGTALIPVEFPIEIDVEPILD